MIIHPLVWSFDTDGVMNDYPEVWLEFIALRIGVKFPSIEDAKTSLGEQYDILKHQYRMSDFKYSVAINPEARETISALKDRGDVVYISTSRPLSNYPHMRSRSIAWLKKGGIEFDGFLEKEISRLKEKQCMIHIDDEIEAIKVISNQGISCILYQREQYLINELPYILRINSLRDLLSKNINLTSHARSIVL